MKFGGTSVGSPEAIGNVVGIIKTALTEGDRPVVVVSAMSGVTDMLIKSVAAAVNRDRWEYESLSRAIFERHREVITMLMGPGARREEALRHTTSLLEQHVQLCQAISVLGEVTPRIMDAVVSFGERLSSRMVAAIMQENAIPSQQFDATHLLVTNDDFQNAEPLWDATVPQIQERLMPSIEAGRVPVITGYIGATAEGIVTTLGRGGSDYSGAIFAAHTHSDELIIWTDVDGVMTTDPRIDKRARVLPQISYQEIGELAFYGAKVLHPKTVQPIIEIGTPVRVRNTFNPSFLGTLITAESEPTFTVIKAVTVVRNISMLTVGGRGMIGVPGIAGRTFMATARAGASVLMISQSSSEQSFCFIIPANKADIARQAIEHELSREIANRDVDSVQIEGDVVIVTAVGAGMRGTPGVAGRVFMQMGQHEVNVLAIAQGSSECSISFAIHADDTERAVLRLHDLALAGI
jgi:aspartate kinase